MKSVERTKKYLFTKGMTRIDILIVVLIAFSVLMIRILDFSPLRSLKSQTDISYGYMARQGSDGFIYVLDDEHGRILSFDENSRIKFAITNIGDKKSEGLYADGFAFDEKFLYINASEWNGMSLTREAILKYDLNGNYIETVTDRDYSEERTNKHRFYGLNADDGELNYIECLKDSFLWGESEIPYPNAFNAVADAAFYKGSFYILDKSGIIYEYSKDGSHSLIYSVKNEEEKYPVPYRMSVDREGNIYFTDVRNDAICRVNRERATSDLVCHTGSDTVYESEDGKLVFCEDEGVIIKDGDNESLYLTLKKTFRQRVTDYLGLFFGIIISILFLIIFIRVIYNLIKRKHSPVKILSFWFVAVIVIVSSILCSMLLNSFKANYRQKLEEQLRCAAYMVANQISAFGNDSIDNVDKISGFGGSSYNKLCEIMDNSFDMRIDIYNNIYCNILKLDKKASKGYAVAYLDQAIGNYYPLDEVETEELKAVYKTKSDVWNQNLADLSGSYLSIKVPVFDKKGEVVAAVAVGAELYVINGIIDDLQKKVLMSIVIMILIIWVVIGEGISFATNLTAYREDVQNKEENVFPGHLIRLLVFLVFAVYNMATTFMPVYIMRQTGIFPTGARDFLGAIPVTINLFIIGLMSLFCARLIRKHGMGKIVAFSVISSMAGNFLMFVYPHYITIVIGLILDGIGVGLITNSIYVLITYIKDEVSRIWGFSAYNGAYLSGINFGMMIGSFLAVMVGHRFVFLIIALVWLCLLVISIYMVRMVSSFIEIQEEERTEESSTAEFVFRKPVISFIALIQNPYIVFGSFAFYYIPLYCDQNGLDETICSLLIMLYSEIAVICGDLFIKNISKSIGNYAIYTAIASNIAAIIVFSLSPNLLGVIIALLLMGIAASYGKPVQQKYFMGFEETRKYGEDKAMGIYNFSENIGESLGPVIMGEMMAAGPASVYVAGFLSLVGGMTSLHYFINRKELKNGR
ncbi:MAG: MFS transporter [Lachnospiraceae bacterium]|nr:MFS transporter [Lachnospiraceae bacterium]